MTISAFMDKHFRHFNSRETLAAARAFKKFVDEENGIMLVSLAGAMSTAEIGVSLAEMIRCGKVQAISCTAANLEEDLFNLFAHDEYKIIDNDDDDCSGDVVDDLFDDVIIEINEYKLCD